MIAFFLAGVFWAQQPAEGDNLHVTLTGLRETARSYLIRPGMTTAQVERIMGIPLTEFTSGPPGQAHTVYSYFYSGVNVSFGPDGKVRGITGRYRR